RLGDRAVDCHLLRPGRRAACGRLSQRFAQDCVWRGGGPLFAHDRSPCDRARGIVLCSGGADDPCRHQTRRAVAPCQTKRVIPKSGYRFSEKITHKRKKAGTSMRGGRPTISSVRGVVAAAHPLAAQAGAALLAQGGNAFDAAAATAAAL